MMSALLLKDLYTLIKQEKIFLLIIIVFAIVPEYTISAFAIFDATMLPMAALAYDERSKWDRLAAMMPYSSRNIVFAKYLLAYIGIVAAGVLSFVTQFFSSLLRNTAIGAEMPVSIMLTVCAASIMLAFNLPIMLRFGVEKGRIAFSLMFGVICTFLMIFSDKLSALSFVATAGIELALLSIAVIVNILSIFLSTAWYKRKAL